MGKNNEDKKERVCEALLVDCSRLIQRFARKGNPDFFKFCEEWKKMHFQHVFSALTTDREIAEVTDEFLGIVKKLLLNEKPLLERVGALYLLYSLYFKQPNEEFCKIKVTKEEWRRLEMLLNEMESTLEIEQPKYIFWKLLSADAFRFTLTKSEHGFEPFYNRDDDTDIFETIELILNPQLKEICDENFGMLSALEIAEQKYNQMKMELHKEGGADFDQLDLIKEIKIDFANILKVLNGDEVCNTNLTKLNVVNSERQAKLKKMAFQRFVETEKGENTFEISTEGDFIHIITSTKTSAQHRKSQRAAEILSDKLPNETLREINKGEE